MDTILERDGWTNKQRDTGRHQRTIAKNWARTRWLHFYVFLVPKALWRRSYNSIKLIWLVELSPIGRSFNRDYEQWHLGLAQFFFHSSDESRSFSLNGYVILTHLELLCGRPYLLQHTVHSHTHIRLSLLHWLVTDMWVPQSSLLVYN